MMRREGRQAGLDRSQRGLRGLGVRGEHDDVAMQHERDPRAFRHRVGCPDHVILAQESILPERTTIDPHIFFAGIAKLCIA